MGPVALRLSSAQLTLGAGSHQLRVLDNLDFELGRGEIVTVVGPSGSGKSTLLSVLAGLLSLDQGDLKIEGHHQDHYPGIVFQNPLLLPWLTVVENVAIGLGYRRQRRLGGRSRATRFTNAQVVLEELGIGDLADRFPHALSGGQAQRVAVARAIAVDPTALLLDEPFGALDPRTRQSLQDWLLELRDQRGLSIVLVTHDVDEALYLGDRVAILAGASHPLEILEVTERQPDRSSPDLTRFDLLDRLGVSLTPAPV